MPIFNRRFIDSEKNLVPPHLASVGPRLPIHVNIPTVLAEALKGLNQKLPSPVKGYCLIDTGASITSVDEEVIVQLGIQPIGKIPVATPDKAEERYVYPALFIFPSPLPTIEFSRVVSLKLSHLNIIALLGRDILQRSALFYNGPGATFTLTI